METLRVGSPEHKRLMSAFFTDSFVKFAPESIEFPELSPADLARLKAMPIWEEAVRTEASTALLVQTFGKKVKDPDLREAIAMNGFEEGRHAAMLAGLTRRYGIEIPKIDVQPHPDPEWGFLKVGYGECFDSFFGFGLFALARESGLFPRSLVGLFEPIMQEEARHIIFHANWVAYARSEQPVLESGLFAFKQALAVAVQTYSRLKTALKIGGSSPQDNFTMNAHESFGELDAKRFLMTCLRENELRLSRYDPRLLRPTLMPKLARAALALL
jgi:hypothetical protein